MPAVFYPSYPRSTKVNSIGLRTVTMTDSMQRVQDEKMRTSGPYCHRGLFQIFRGRRTDVAGATGVRDGRIWNVTESGMSTKRAEFFGSAICP